MFEELTKRASLGHRFITVGDMHLNHTTPSSRIDSYPETTILKLESLLEICKQQGVKLVVALGDVFHKPAQPISYVNKVIDTLDKFAKEDIMIVSCIGNHTIFFDSLEGIEKSAIYTLDKSQVLRYPSILHFGDYTFRLFPYPDKLVAAQGSNEIAVAHRFYENTLTESSLTRRLLGDLGYKYYLLGHDHVKYPTDVLSNGAKVVRPGSFTRGTSHQYSLETTVTVSLIDLDKDTIEEIPIYQQPASQVFTESVLHKKEISVVDISDSLKELMSAITTVETSGDLEALFTQMEMPDDVRKVLKEYFRIKGIYLN